jgi:hypothetical protein
VKAITFAGASLTNLGIWAFNGCNNESLTSIDMSAQTNLVSIPDYAFQNTTHLASFKFPPKITTIGVSSFNASALTSISIPSTVKRIGTYAFFACTPLATITLPETNDLVSIGEFAFGSNTLNGTSWLTNQKSSTTNGMIYLGNVALIYNGTAPAAISGTAGLEKSTVVGVAGGCFRGNTNITSVTIPSTVKNIDENAFINCTGLKTATLSADLTSMGQDVFTGCTALTDVYVKNTTAPTTAASTFLTTSTNTNTTVYIPESDDIAVTEYGDATKGHKAAYHTDFWTTNTKGLKYYHDGLNTALKYFESTKGSQKAFSTLYVNFPYELPTTDMKAYTVSEDNASNVVMTEITGSPVVIPAQTPVLLVSDAAASGLIVKETTNAASTIGANKLSGTLTGTTKTAVENGTNKLYTFGVGTTSGIVGFYTFNGTTIPAHKAYLLSSTGTQSKAFTFDGGLTGIKTIFSAPADKTTPFYELSGKIATHLEKGNIYIKNGKKIIY